MHTCCNIVYLPTVLLGLVIAWHFFSSPVKGLYFLICYAFILHTHDRGEHTATFLTSKQGHSARFTLFTCSVSLSLLSSPLLSSPSYSPLSSLYSCLCNAGDRWNGEFTTCQVLKIDTLLILRSHVRTVSMSVSISACTCVCIHQHQGWPGHKRRSIN